ncbi:DUF6009 family protein [Streptomyces anulatus]|uniref:DUF6009 family protein n=1 Tax=Streptomyces anulatus TaxID=1892 RepID=UPI00362F24E0
MDASPLPARVRTPARVQKPEPPRPRARLPRTVAGNRYTTQAPPSTRCTPTKEGRGHGLATDRQRPHPRSERGAARRPEHPDNARHALDKTPRRKNEPHYARDGRMIGRIELGADTEADPDRGLYRRRVFFLLPATTPATPTPKAFAGKAPPAKPPRTVQPNRLGEKTSRSQQGSPSVLAATGSWDREPAPSHGCVP